MNERLEHYPAVNRHTCFDHSILAELIARRWKQDRSYLTRAQLKASWWSQSRRSVLGWQGSQGPFTSPGSSTSEVDTAATRGLSHQTLTHRDRK
jgi:hypothetical protein